MEEKRDAPEGDTAAVEEERAAPGSTWTSRAKTPSLEHTVSVTSLGSSAGIADPPRHPTAVTWKLPPRHRPAPAAGLRRANLRELLARPGRFEHHLTVVARVGVAQIEAVNGGPSLVYFAHGNVSDELALALPCGDPLVDALPLRTFALDPATNEDVGRVNHRVHDMVLHPHGLLHWPGRLRPPHEPPRFTPGTRRTLISVVCCASRPTPRAIALPA